ncbi:MAG: hypothetical protein Q4D38_13595 [Planctomycetia bacterium]|nr:hypothetical protein [Planctomycetia bacterium]
MKRTLFTLLLFLSPLVFLTATAGVDFISVPNRTVPDDTELLASTRRAMDDVSRRSRNLENTMEGLIVTELILPASDAASEKVRSYGFLRGATAAFEKWNALSGYIFEYLDILQNFRSTDLDQVTWSMRKFREIREEFSSALPPGSVKSELEAQEKALEARIVKARRVGESTKILGESRNAYESKDYSICRDKCNVLLADYDDILDAVVRREVQRLKNMSEVFAGRDELGDIRLSQESPEAQLEKVQEIVDRYEGIDESELSDAEKTQLEESRALATDLRIKILEEQYSGEIDIAISDFGARKNLPLRELLSSAQDLIAKINAFQDLLKDDDISRKKREELDAQKKRVRTVFRRRMQEKIPEVKFTQSPLLQEAEMKDGSILRGFFRLVEQDGKVVGYKCYPTQKEYDNPTVSVGMRPSEDFKTPPSIPLEAGFCQKYAEAKKKLAAQMDTRGAWIDFHNSCKKMDDRLREHEKKTKQETGISFRGAADVSRVILKDENWSKIQEIFR